MTSGRRMSKVYGSTKYQIRCPSHDARFAVDRTSSIGATTPFSPPRNRHSPTAPPFSRISRSMKCSCSAMKCSCSNDPSTDVSGYPGPHLLVETHTFSLGPDQQDSFPSAPSGRAHSLPAPKKRKSALFRELLLLRRTSSSPAAPSPIAYFSPLPATSLRNAARSSSQKS